MTKIASEISGQPQTPDRGGYTVTMREDPGTAIVLQQLAADNPEPGRLHLGWGSFRNLDIVAARQSTCALIFDLNQHQLTVWHTLAKLIQDCETAEELVRYLAASLPDKPRLRRFTNTIEEWLLSDLLRAESWLSTSNRHRFQYIRDLFRNGAIGILCLDLCDYESHPDQHRQSGFPRLASVLEQLSSAEKMFTDTLYLSNIPYMLQNKRGFFGKPEWRWISNAQVEFYTTSGDASLRMMWNNLQSVIRPATLTVQATQLASGFTEKDPQWQTTVSSFEVAKEQGMEGES